MLHPHSLIVAALFAVLWSILSLAQASAAVTANLQGRFLNVKGTPGSDIILIYHTGRQVVLLAIDANFVMTQQAWRPAQIFNILIEAGGGNDLVFSAGDLRVETWGNDDNDFLVAAARVDPGFAGGKHNDMVIEMSAKGGHLHLGDHSDLGISNRGSDWHLGAKGPDLMYGGDKWDSFWADDGNDVLIGGKGPDSMHGDADNDVLFGGDGEDSMFGGTGNDLLCGWNHHDELWGGIGDDWLYGEQGPDDHVGGPGNDELFGAVPLGDTFAAGRINPDALCGQPAGGIEASIYNHESYILVVGTDGNDEINVRNTGDGIQVEVNGAKQESRLIAGADLKSLAVISRAGNDDISIEGAFDRIAFIGEDGDDNLDMSRGTARQAVLMGGAGDDVLAAGAALTVAWGGMGEDQFLSGPGRDFILADTDDRITGNEDDDMIVTADVVDEIGDPPDTDQTTRGDTASDTETIIKIVIALLFGLVIGFVVGRRRN